MSETKGGVFDVVIIGSGPGGYVAAVRAGQLGLRTAIVEKDDKVGGTCLWRGCIPTKALLHNAYLYEQILDAKKLGIEVDNVRLNFPEVMKNKDLILKKLGAGVAFLMKKNKVQVFTGYGKIRRAGLVEVAGADKAVTLLETKNIIIATGSEAKAFPGMEPDGKGIITNIEALALPAVPKSLIVIGAGAVGIEFASIYRSFGSEVAVVEMMNQVLPLEDEEIAKELQKVLEKRGIKIRTGSKTESIKAVKGGYEVRTGGASSETLTAEKVLVAVGRKPNVENLGLENTKVKVEKGFIQVDATMRTAEPGIYAIGDVVPTPLLAHLASAEGILAVEHLKGLEVQPINYDRIPNVTYCDPQVGSVGLTEKKAKERGHDVKVGKFPFGALGKARIEHEEDGFIKIVADAKYGEILGVHILHAKAGDLIPEAVAILNAEMTVDALLHTIHPHPTLSEAVSEAAHSIYGAPIHL
jgi:dihydrolipoamide dehydrogenase